MGKRLSALVFASMIAVAASGNPDDNRPHLAPVGAIEGTVTLEPPPPPRRSAQRYPGGQAEVHQVQELPAVAYLVGAVAGDGGGVMEAQSMTQRDTAFVPAVVHVQVGGLVAFPNGDPFFHNVFSYSSAQRFDLGRYPQGESKAVTFDEPGIVELFCEVHDFMRGAIIVTENPFAAVVAEDGTFRMENVPEGEHTIAFWQQDHRPVEQRVVVTAGGTARVEVELNR